MVLVNVGAGIDLSAHGLQTEINLRPDRYRLNGRQMKSQSSDLVRSGVRDLISKNKEMCLSVNSLTITS